MTTQELTNTPEQWANQIKQELTRTVEGFIKAGGLLTSAKKEIKHGDWERWLQEDVQISPRWAQQLMNISNKLASKARYNALLPPNSDTLMTIASLDGKQIEAAIESGKISPDMTRNAARELVREIKGTVTKTVQPVKPFTDNYNVNVSQPLAPELQTTTSASPVGESITGIPKFEIPGLNGESQQAQPQVQPKEQYKGSCWHCHERDARFDNPMCRECELELAPLLRQKKLSIVKNAHTKISAYQAIDIVNWIAETDIPLGQLIYSRYPCVPAAAEEVSKVLQQQNDGLISVIDMFNMFFRESGKIVPMGRDPNTGRQFYEVQEYSG